MSIARPTNREEFRQYILTKLGAPVLEVNVAEEQIDLAIEDAFQYFNERSHFLGTERMYLTFRMTSEFIEAFTSFNVQEVNQSGDGKIPIPGRPTQFGVGFVKELNLLNPGKNYPPNSVVQTNINTTTLADDIDITAQDGDVLQSDAGDDIVYETKSTGKGTGLTVTIGPERTAEGGITNVSIYNCGSGYEVGDVVSVTSTIANSARSDALFEVSALKTESATFGIAPVRSQNNYLVLPSDVVAVNGVLRSTSSDMLGIFPGGSVFPLMLGGVLGNDFACGNSGYDLVSYVAMQEYLATLQFLFFPPIQYNFNQRTHRLFIDSNDFGKAGGAFNSGAVGSILCLDCMVKPSPDVFPDLWNDLWMKKYCTALVKAQWGRNLTKYSQVNLPGGITMNGDQILSQGNEEIKALEDRFSMDWADPPLDLVG